MHHARPHDSRLVRVFCLAAGTTALLLGIAGVVLPLLPTTPFILLAAACFARGSVRVHDWLLNQRLAGPIIREWQTHRAMPRQAKRAAFALLLLSFGSSILYLDLLWHRAMLLALGLALAFFLWRVPVRPLPQNDDREPARPGSS